MKAALITLALAGVFLAGCQGVTEPALIGPDEYDTLAGEAIVIDVHVPEQEHLPGTDHVINYQDRQGLLDVLPDKDTPVIVYCRSGSMSAEAANFLSEQGYSEVYDLQGGRNQYVSQRG